MLIPGRLVALIVIVAIDLDREPGLDAGEVQAARSGRLLAAEVEARRISPEVLPEGDFGWPMARRAALAATLARSFAFRMAPPSTTRLWRAVPSPGASLRGRNKKVYCVVTVVVVLTAGLVTVRCVVVWRTT